MKFFQGIVGVVGLTAALLLLVGCERRVTQSAPPTKKTDDRATWWCPEHGIPEKECSMCVDEDAKKRMFKDKGDWCEKHPDRAKSQCFICDPSLQEKFAARYRERYGEEPPPITDPDPKKDK